MLGLGLSLADVAVLRRGGGGPPLPPVVALAPTARATILNTTTNGKWTNVQSPAYTTVTFPVAAPTGQTSGAKLAMGDTDTVAAIRTVTNGFTSFALTSSNIYGVLGYLDADPPAGMTFQLRLMKDTSNYKTYQWAKGTNSLRKGWNYLVAFGNETGSLNPAGAWTTTGAVAFGDTIALAEMRTLKTSAVGSAIGFYPAEFFRYTAPIANPALVLDAIGSFQSNVDLVGPALASRSLTASFEIGNDDLTTNIAVAKAQVAMGWDAVRQSPNHTDATLDVPGYEAGLISLQSQMAALGLVTADNMMAGGLPFASANGAVRDAALRQGMFFQSETVTPLGIVAPYGNAAGGMFSLQSMDMGVTLLAAAKVRIDAAKAYGASVSIKWHEVVVGDGDTTTLTGNSNQTKLAALTGALDYAIAQGVIVTRPTTFIRSVQAV